MTGQHTPGPWVVNPLCAQVDCGRVSARGGLLPVALMLWPTDERSEVETDANARLIAAAPDGHEIIEQLEESFTADGTYQQFLPAMRAYLTKVGGGRDANA